jgi:AraC-like DNA-binding protein
MDKTVGSPLAGIPPHALSIRLARSTIRMRHAPSWRIDKSNQVHDLIVCLSGGAHYVIDGKETSVRPGGALLIPARTRFRGRHVEGDLYTGIAQHFTLELFGNVDFIAQMELMPVAPLRGWDVLEPLVRHYHDTAPPSATTLAQHHQFMVFLLQYLEDAFLGWREHSVGAMAGQDALSLHIMLSAARLAADPLADGALNGVLDRAPYNADYFRRAFRERIGYTPQKFLEFKKMERAMHILGTGKSVKETAAEIGYEDAYFFSRMFKRYLGASPSTYRLRGRERLTFHE